MTMENNGVSSVDAPTAFGSGTAHGVRRQPLLRNTLPVSYFGELLFSAAITTWGKLRIECPDRATCMDVREGIHPYFELQQYPHPSPEHEIIVF